MPVIDRTKYLHQDSVEETLNDKPPSRLTKNFLTALIVCFGGVVAGINFSVSFFTADYLIQSFYIRFNPSFIAMGLISIIYIARPFGGYLIGRYGDIYGRKKALKLSLSILCLSCLLIALLPTSPNFTKVSSFLLVVILFIQGGTFGGLVVLNWVVIAETIAQTKLTLYMSVITASTLLGAVICASLTAIIEFSISHEAMLSFGWRAVFLIGAGLSLVAVHLGKWIQETPLFADFKEREGYIPPKQQQLPVNYLHAVLVTGLLSVVISCLASVIVIIMPLLIDLQFSIDETILKIANISGILCSIIGMVFFSWLATKIGIGRTLRIGSIILSLSTFALFQSLSISGGLYIIPIYAFLGFSGGMASLCVVLFMKLFPITTRLKTITIIFNGAAVISGTLLPFFLIYFTKIYSFSPALFIIFLCVVTFITSLHACHPANKNELKEINSFSV